jgi:uncharacterized membrane protein (UPF0127 family)
MRKFFKGEALIADKCVVADRFGLRLVGLLGRSQLAMGEGMFFPNCSSVHTWGMRFEIDVVFVRRKEEGFEITKLEEKVRPWRLLPLVDAQAWGAIELPAGRIKEMGLQKGDFLQYV